MALGSKNILRSNIYEECRSNILEPWQDILNREIFRYKIKSLIIEEDVMLH